MKTSNALFYFDLVIHLAAISCIFAWLPFGHAFLLVALVICIAIRQYMNGLDLGESVPFNDDWLIQFQQPPATGLNGALVNLERN